MNARIDLMHVIPEAGIRVGLISSAQQFERMEEPRRKDIVKARIDLMHVTQASSK